MTAQTWRAHYAKKYQYSLRLFLLLNFISSSLSLVTPLFTVVRFTLPCALIVVCSGLLLLWHWKWPQSKINIPTISLLFGMLWAWHVVTKAMLLTPPHFNYLVIALLSILFIGTIAFSNNITAFTLHSLPTFLACLIMAEGEQWLRMTYCFMLPIAGITLQNIIQKRSDAFTQGLMDKLMHERNTLNDLSMLDPLTGLYNRRGLQNRLDTLLALDGDNHYVLLLDIDHFKAYNDHYGHMMGDQALIRVSAAIRNAVRSRDIVARFGGEEFMVLLTNSSEETAWKTAERIRQRVYDLKIPHMFNESVATNVTISIGLTPLINDNIEQALARADGALYEAKNKGRNIILAS
ncbi:GGDEF domain-containing protein [Klebsiella pneumoniae]|uniref:GGDEF domain-containing protein n=1 Tax=Klebsiella pneumoniae TaxID=573 RepID=UPI00210A4461|nr:GGDEF domain-containing protein [Klebsiella pneumoniae]MCQ4014959.1 GGDEF domain-containing protein [Klebsiella pneumoniae]